MKKILITLLFVMFITSFINAKERKTLNTKHFEIIFTEESEDTALKIYNCAENMYENITAAFDTDINLKIPVTILHDIQVINAYFTSIPYNRIVLYDTVIEGSLDVFENSIEKIFYHELTHAITLNLKKPILRLMPVLSPTNFTLTTFWDEGATVYMESRESEYGKNEGRLNDPYSIQLAVQTILENKFPSWRDVTGARDISPSGTASYIFGGLFTNYLIEEYGLEKYAEFWKLANAVIPFSLVAGIFKKNYGTKMDNEWKKYGAKLKEYAEALNAKELENPLLKDSGNHQISYIEKYKDGIIYFDSTCNGIFEKTTSTKNKAKKILSIKNVKKLSASKNGRYIAISYYIYKSQIKAESLIYDTQKKRIIKIKEDDSRDITIVEENDDNLKVMVVKKYGLNMKIHGVNCELTVKRKKSMTIKNLLLKAKRFLLVFVEIQ